MERCVFKSFLEVITGQPLYASFISWGSSFQKDGAVSLGESAPLKERKVAETMKEVYYEDRVKQQRSSQESLKVHRANTDKAIFGRHILSRGITTTGC